MRHMRALTALLVMLAPAWLALGQAPTRTERLVVGEQRVLAPGYAVGDIAISNPAVCDFRVVSGRREVLLVASGEGLATLTIWDQGGTKRDEVAIDVMSREMARLMDDLRELLKPYPGVSVKRLGTRLVLAGDVQSAEELQTVRTIADAAPGVISTVTVRGAAVPAPPAAAPPAAVSRVLPDPPPPLAVPKPVGGAPDPVQRTAPPAVAVPVPGAAPPTGMPAAPPVQAVAVPPPPNVSIGAVPSPPAPLPAQQPAASTGGAAPAATVEYLIEIYESPAGAPPPEVAGPQGRKIYSGILRATAGQQTRQYIGVGPQTAKPPRAISIGVTPTIDGAQISTAAVIDTNLPLGHYEQKSDPVWLRSAINFAGAAGQAHFVGELELADVARPATAPPAEIPGSGTAGKVADAAIDVGTRAAAGNVPGASYIPGFGSLFGGGGSGQPKAKKTMLLFVFTPRAGVPR